MSTLSIGLSIFGAMLVLMAVRVPIAIAMFVPGALGLVGVADRSAFVWDRQSNPVTLSTGVANLSSAEKDSQALIEAADAALYQAKRSGRNRVVVAA